MAVKRDAFVIMPFSATPSCSEAEWTDIFENIFQPALHEVGYTCERAQPGLGSLPKSIVDRLRNAHVVLADLTDRNANVFYELGVRHALSKRTIIVTQDESHVPSDLRGYWFTVYGQKPGQVKKFKQQIQALIQQIEAAPDANDSPVSDYLDHENLSVSRVVNAENIRKLTALYTETTGNREALKVQIDGSEGPLLISDDCLRLLLTTLYVDPGPEILKQAYELQRLYASMQLRPVVGGADRVLQHALTSTISFGNTVRDLREQIVRGEFREGENASLMVWTRPDGATATRHRRQSCEPLFDAERGGGVVAF
jgi:hypothetical protein